MSKSDEDLPLPLSSRKYSGKFMVRVPPEVHRHLAIEAAEAGVSLNRIAVQNLRINMMLAVRRLEKRKLFSKEKENKFQRCIEIMA